jgi:putative ATP-dependent endonuclease of the OLD family
VGRVTALRVEDYKSVHQAIEIAFPEGMPVVLVGENNAGKSNIAGSLELLLGESWPGSWTPIDHDYFDRDSDNVPIRIRVSLNEVTHVDRYGNDQAVESLEIEYPDQDESGRPFQMVFADGSRSIYVSNDVREQCVCMMIGADRRLTYQLSYTSKWTFLSKLMRKFHESLVAEPDRVNQLKSQFGDIVSVFRQVPEFEEFSRQLKEQVADLSANLQYGLDVDFSAYDPSNYFRSLRVQPTQNDEPRSFEELGTGQEHVLALSFAYAYATAFRGATERLLLVVEEPEAHLHPLAEEWLSSKVREIAAAGVQVLVTTHSPTFIDLRALEGIVLVTKQGSETRVKQLTREELADFCVRTGAPKASPEIVMDFYAAAATEEILSGFFARRVVLVEGPTEALALPSYFSRLGLSPPGEGIAFLPVHGVANLAKWWRLFSAYGIPVYVVFDNDASDDTDGGRRIELLRALGLDEAEARRMITAKDWIVADRFAVCGRNFEEMLREAFPGSYSQLEETAKREFGLAPGQGKPLIARFVADRIDLDAATEGRKRLGDMARMVGAM